MLQNEHHVTLKKGKRKFSASGFHRFVASYAQCLKSLLHLNRSKLKPLSAITFQAISSPQTKVPSKLLSNYKLYKETLLWNTETLVPSSNHPLRPALSLAPEPLYPRTEPVAPPRSSEPSRPSAHSPGSLGVSCHRSIYGARACVCMICMLKTSAFHLFLSQIIYLWIYFWVWPMFIHKILEFLPPARLLGNRHLHHFIDELHLWHLHGPLDLLDDRHMDLEARSVQRAPHAQI